MTEDQIVEGCRRRDRTAQRELYAQTSKKIYRLLRRMTRNSDDAFDLTQSTYLRVFERIDQFDGASRLTSWVYRIAINEALQFLRQRRRHESRLAKVAKSSTMAGPQESEDVQMDVEEALAKLSEPDRALIVLRYIEGLSYTEIAQVLEKPVGTISSGLNRARQALRDALEPRGAWPEETPDRRHPT